MGQSAAILDENISIEVDKKLSPSQLSSTNKQHLKSLRIKKGEKINLLNGRGQIAELCFDGTDFDVLNIIQKQKLSPEIHILMSPPTNDALTQAIQQSTEVGASSFQFFRSDYCQWKKSKPINISRLQRVSSAACKQCLQAWVPEIHDDILASLQEAIDYSTNISFVADEDLHKDLDSFTSQLPNLAKLTKDQNKISLIIGPEGGWSPAEHKLIDEHCHKLSLGSLVLRVPTACVAAITLLRSQL